MKLNELLGVKKFANMTRDEIAGWAENQGKWKPLGQGAHAHVFELEGVVYKFWFKDAAYEEWVKFCAAHQDNPYVPKFKSTIKEVPAAFLRHYTTPETIKYIKMEKLSKFRGYNPVQLFKDDKLPKVIFEDVLQELYRQDEPTKARCESMIIHVAQKQADHHTNSALDDGEDSEFVKLNGVKIDHPEGLHLLELVTGVQTLRHKHGFNLDLHDLNMALRGSTPVLIDPFAEDESLSRNRYWSQFEKMLNMSPGYRKSGEAKRNSKTGNDRATK